MNSTDAFLFQDITATTDPFTLMGGKYDVRVQGAAAVDADVSLETLGPDGTTWLIVGTVFEDAGIQTHDLASGQYRFTLGATAADISAVVARIPA